MLTVMFSVGKAGVGGGEEKLEGIKVREGYFCPSRLGKLGVQELAETFEGLLVVKSLANGFREDLGESFSAATNTSSVLSLCKKNQNQGFLFDILPFCTGFFQNRPRCVAMKAGFAVFTKSRVPEPLGYKNH